VPRIRFRFAKTGPVRFISHRDTMRVFARALRRTGLAFSMTKGYNPHIRFSLPLPLPVGEEGLNELGEIRVEGPVEAAEFSERLNVELPEGLVVESAAVLTHPGKARPVEAIYEIAVPREDARRVKAALEGVLAGDVLVATRRRRSGVRTRNIRPFIKDIRWVGDRTMMHIGLTGEGSTGPAEVIALCTDDRTARRLRIVRTTVVV